MSHIESPESTARESGMKQTEEPALQKAEQEPIYLQQLFARFRAKRRFLAVFTTACCFIVLVLVLLVERRYTVEATLFPVDPNVDTAGGISAQFAAAFLPGSRGYQDFYPQIAVSRTVLDDVVAEPFPCSKCDSAEVGALRFFDLDDLPPGEAAQKLYDHLVKKVVRARVDLMTGALKIRVDTRDPLVAATIANRVAENLDKYVRRLRTETTRQQRESLELRLSQVASALQEAEVELAIFLKRNRRIEDSPELLIKSAQLKRQVAMHEAVYLELKRAEEMNRVEEMRDTPRVHLLDRAVPPLKPSYPARTLMMVLTFFASLGLGLLIVLLEPTLRTAWSGNPAASRERLA